MAHDDPQKRIVDLERQPAEQNRGAGRRKRNRILLSANVTAVVIALAAAMLVIVISACGANSLSGSRHSVRVAAVKGQPSADAMATLMNQGFKVRRLPKPDSTVCTGLRHRYPACRGRDRRAGLRGRGQRLHRSGAANDPRCVQSQFCRSPKHPDSGRLRHSQASPHTIAPEQKDRVLGTNPAANQTAPVTVEISVFVGSGPMR